MAKRESEWHFSPDGNYKVFQLIRGNSILGRVITQRSRMELLVFLLNEHAQLETKNEGLVQAIQTVLDDEESKEGGWGPDVSMVAVLRNALRDN